MSKTGRVQYTVVIEDNDKPGGVPPIIRLRGWLKCGLRRFGLKCLAVVEGDTRADLAKARAVAEGLADRVAAQSELLSQRAERENRT